MFLAHAFASIQFIDRNVNNGWLIHGFHATGTTMLFGTIYLLLFRGILTRNYRAPGELVWVLGVALFSLLLLVGYLGYALTGGAVSYWSLVAQHECGWHAGRPARRHRHMVLRRAERAGNAGEAGGVPYRAGARRSLAYWRCTTWA